MTFIGTHIMTVMDRFCLCLCEFVCIMRLLLRLNICVFVYFLFLASLYAIARPSVVCLSSVCLSVMLVHPTQAVEIFGNISRAFGTFAIR